MFFSWVFPIFFVVIASNCTEDTPLFNDDLTTQKQCFRENKKFVGTVSCLYGAFFVLLLYKLFEQENTQKTLDIPLKPNLDCHANVKMYYPYCNLEQRYNPIGKENTFLNSFTQIFSNCRPTNKLAKELCETKPFRTVCYQGLNLYTKIRDPKILAYQTSSALEEYLFCKDIVHRVAKLVEKDFFKRGVKFEKLVVPPFLKESSGVSHYTIGYIVSENVTSSYVGDDICPFSQGVLLPNCLLKNNQDPSAFCQTNSTAQQYVKNIQKNYKLQQKKHNNKRVLNRKNKVGSR